MKKIFYTFLLISPLLFVASCEDNSVVHGCLDSQACNYNSQANIDNNSCEYPEEGYDCEGNLTPYIGMQFEGGIIFYLEETGRHGLVAAMEDLEGSYQWGCYGESVYIKC